PSTYIYGNTILKVGQPLGLLYGKVFEGILKTQQEVDDYKKTSYYAAYAIPFTGIGDAKYKVTGIPIAPGFTQSFYANDVIGHAQPNYYGGYTNTIRYKDFSLTALATFSQGGDIIYVADIQNLDLSSRGNKGVSILGRWTPENPNATRPKLVLNQSAYTFGSSLNIYKASYVKIKSVSLNYQLPKKLLDRLKISSGYLYVSATNLFTFTKYPGADPEVSNDPYSLIGGYSDSGGYPTVKQFSVGLRCGF
ncbi:MAG: TonB-dependent receptor, partial [Mucilaginibacter sp.]|nr:TonB-dependent receptor [Mucilaginibacter sp.]